MKKLAQTAEALRLEEDARRRQNWKRWGPYLSERQWGTVREDYSAHGDSWGDFPFAQAASRTYRWGEDGLLGITDRQNRLCFALALWNGRDAILKERLFGLTGPQGNHGEDVKECYYYLDSTPTHSYMKALYKYPKAEFPYQRLLAENRQRGRNQLEFELADTGIFDQGRYFDIQAEYAKAGPDDLLIRLSVSNRGPEAATVDVLPTVWFRNTWSWGRDSEEYWPEPTISRSGDSTLLLQHASLGTFSFQAGPDELGQQPAFLFTNNETNSAKLFGSPNRSPYVKDAFHRYLIQGERGAVHPETGTKAAALYHLEIPAGQTVVLQLRLAAGKEAAKDLMAQGFAQVFTQRQEEADEFYAALAAGRRTPPELAVMRQACAGLMWTKQFYYYVVQEWLEGDPASPPPPDSRRLGRNQEWKHLYNDDIISMPDKWEYPWYAAWDLAFHMIPCAKLDASLAQEQLLLFLREWYMHPNGQLPAYEFNFSDVNPPVHAWGCWRVYQMTGDRVFLARTFQKLLLNFTWWVNRKDHDGNHVFSGGFLGLDNIGVFDRSKPLPTGGYLEQADGTAWMAFYCSTMLDMALELAREDSAYEDIASKFFEHFVAIAEAINTMGECGLWDDQDGFYYDELNLNGKASPLRIRSMVGIIPLFAVGLLDEALLERLPGFRQRMDWFLRNKPGLAQHITHLETPGTGPSAQRLLALPSRERLARVLSYVLDEEEFLSPYGVRSLSKIHAPQPYVLGVGREEYRVEYVPGESDTGLFGGNSNWRGPVWFPVNYLLIEALETYHRFYGDDFQVECPTGSGQWMNLQAVARELSARLARLFLPGEGGKRPCHGGEGRYAQDPHWQDLILFYEYFHGDTGRGLGASHQTGWTALVVSCLERLG